MIKMTDGVFSSSVFLCESLCKPFWMYKKQQKRAGKWIESVKCNWFVIKKQRKGLKTKKVTQNRFHFCAFYIKMISMLQCPFFAGSFLQKTGMCY
ncbi:MAG: hypothetical protein Q4B22_05940 [Eubacteriales bacterium]|nr:hypothetical protein [Eubacteriales bacterium]